MLLLILLVNLIDLCLKIHLLLDSEGQDESRVKINHHRVQLIFNVVHELVVQLGGLQCLFQSFQLLLFFTLLHLSFQSLRPLSRWDLLMRV
jgi:hypothetical protein